MTPEQGSMFDAPNVNDVRTADIIDELKRELAMRRSVYPRWIQSGKITPEDAERRTLVLAAALAHFQNISQH